MEIIDRNNMHILNVGQDLTIKNAEKFKSKMNELTNAPFNYLVLDLEEVNYLNSSALGIIANAAMLARKKNKELVISGMSASIREIFEIVKFSTFMKFFLNLEEAEKYFINKDTPLFN